MDWSGLSAADFRHLGFHAVRLRGNWSLDRPLLKSVNDSRLPNRSVVIFHIPGTPLILARPAYHLHYADTHTVSISCWNRSSNRCVGILERAPWDIDSEDSISEYSAPSVDSIGTCHFFGILSRINDR